MNEVKLQLPTPEDINAQIVRSIAASAIGAELHKIINEQVQRIAQTYDSPLKKVVESEIIKLLREIVQEHFIEKIRAQVREKVTEKFTDDLVNDLWQKWIDRSFR